MPHDISDNQRRLMRAIEGCTVESPASTRKLGAVKDTHGSQLTPDIARKALDRLEKRGFVDGEGRGLDRRWWVTAAGESVLQGSAEEARDWTRPYVVLEAVTLEDLMRSTGNGEPLANGGLLLYVEVATVPARNTEHAYRLAAGESAEPRATTMVAVATRNFQPEPVTIRNDLNISVG